MSIITDKTAMYGSTTVQSHDSPRLITKLTLRGESLETFKMAWPIILTYLFQTGTSLICVMFAGHIGSLELASAALGMMFCNVVGVSLGYGLVTALDTLTSQAYGAGHFSLVGIHCQRGAVILTLSLIPVAVILFHAEDFLLFAGQEPDTSRLAARFCQLYFPGLLGLYWTEVIKRFLQVQSRTGVIISVSGLTTGVAPFLAWWLIFKLDLGFDGCALAMATSSTLTALGLIFAILLRPELRDRCWSGFSMECFSGWGLFFELGIPGLVMLCAEWWAFELLAIMAGWKGELVLATHSIVMNFFSFAFMVPWGLGDVASVRVGRYLGANRPADAKFCATTMLKLVLLVESSLAVTIVLLRHVVPRLFSDVPAVINLTANTLFLGAAFMLFDGAQCVMSGIMRGSGKQELAARVNLVAFYLLALPCSYFLAGPWGIYGIWMGISLASIIQVLALGIILHRLDWRRASRQAELRTESFLFDFASESPQEEANKETA